MNITLTKKEQRLFELFLDVVREKAPDTILRVAGGWVRDKLLGKDSDDIDISLNNMSGEDFANLVLSYMRDKKITNKGGVSVVKANPSQSKHLATAMMDVLGHSIDFVNLRKENYASSRIPTVEPGTPQEDASRRDLTINSLFYNINNGKIEDFVDGLKDLRAGIARTPIDSFQTWIDDPLRILRTIRFAAKYKLSIDNELFKVANRPDVQKAFADKVSQERVWKEMAGQESPNSYKFGFLNGPDPEEALYLVHKFGFSKLLFGLDDDSHLRVAKRMLWGSPDENKLLRSLSAIFYNSAENAEKYLKKLKAPNDIIKKVKLIVSNRDKILQISSDMEMRRILGVLKEQWEMTFNLEMSRRSASLDNKWDAEKIYDLRIRFQKMIDDMGGYKPKSPVTGKDLIRIGFQPGKAIGNALKDLNERLLEDPDMPYSAAIRYCRDHLSSP